MRCCDHIYIVSTIADCQSCLLWGSFTNHLDDLRLLQGTHSAGEDYICIVTEFYEIILQAWNLLDLSQCVASNDHCIVTPFLGYVLLSQEIVQLFLY